MLLAIAPKIQSRDPHITRRGLTPEGSELGREMLCCRRYLAVRVVREVRALQFQISGGQALPALATDNLRGNQY